MGKRERPFQRPVGMVMNEKESVWKPVIRIMDVIDRNLFSLVGLSERTELLLPDRLPSILSVTRAG
eukprot:CAMPEP_0184685546 /NCGR_PEP_ID=MMETSP0312-20130426/19385_1 /TAXON_ID=31354 /ORGANISM="Compsopogon coeruleus, Strain SAG 36.94" /LENGTH=65 /DNA_ID=CAMNT_0027139753 /DNA_START=9 /DNA_END=203 /DNA_ORIENTATION=-